MKPITHDEQHSALSAGLNAVYTRIAALEDGYRVHTPEFATRLTALEESLVSPETVTHAVDNAKGMLRREQTTWRKSEKQHRINADAGLQTQIDALKTRVEEMARGESIMERIAHKTISQQGAVEEMERIRNGPLSKDAALKSLQATVGILRQRCTETEEEAARYKEEWQQAARERDDISERLLVTQRDHERLQQQIAEMEENYIALNKAYCDGEGPLLDQIALLQEKLAEVWTERDNEEAEARYHKQAAKDATVLRQQAMADAEKWQRHLHAFNPITFADTARGVTYDAQECRVHGACHWPSSSYHVHCGVKR